MKVKIIEKNDVAAIVEHESWNDVHRVMIPVETIESIQGEYGYISEDSWSMGISYGIPWDEIVENITVDVQDLARLLRQKGIWTYKDIEKNASAIRGVIGEFIAPIQQQILLDANIYRKQKGDSNG